LSEPRILASEQSGIADAHRKDEKRFVVRGDEKLTANSAALSRKRLKATTQQRATLATQSRDSIALRRFPWKLGLAVSGER
jgi:hypothetical protein